MMVDTQSWLEVSLIVDGELAESVAEVMSRYVKGGVAIESTAVTANDDDEGGRSVGPLRVCGYIPVDEDLEAARHKLEEGLWFLGRIRPLPEAQFRTIQEADWAEAWKAHYHPIPIGKKLIIVPAWLESPEKERIPIKMDPGMAFGTGTHPTTQLSLEMVESWVRPGEPVIDVGCGSGILAIAALKMGASHALGVDIDRQSPPITAENALANGVSERMETGLGSVGEVLNGQFSIRQAPLVLANILAPILVRLFEAGMAELIAPGGGIVLSGILAEQWEDAGGTSVLREAVKAQNLELKDYRRSGDWIALYLERPQST
jgi:ribosomal protein L11 methyltransferase